MKKLLIMLMVVAMASFLFVGCIPTTPDVDEDDEEPLPTPPPATVAPIITSVPDIVGGYINKANAADGIVVNGTAPTYSEVKVYINGLTAGTGDTEANGVFQVVVAKADLIKAVKTDGAKVLYATATEAGLAESASSNVKTFILDTTLPGIEEVKATASEPAVGGTAVATTASASTVITTELWVTPADIVSGTWTLDFLGPNALRITDPDGDPTAYDLADDGQIFGADAPIPGVSFQIKSDTVVAAFTNAGDLTFADNDTAPDTITSTTTDFAPFGLAVPGLDVIIISGSDDNDGIYTIADVTVNVATLVATDELDDEDAAIGDVTITASWLTAGQKTEIVCTADVDAIPSRATLEFDEDVSSTAALAGTYTINAAATGVPDTYKESNDTGYWLSPAGVGAIGTNALFVVSDVEDLAGNVIAPFSSASCVVGSASLTVLAP